MSVTIYGAGMAGLLAAHMLRRHEPVVFEAQKSLPNNHDALLRFRSDAVSKATGIPFKKVCVQKGVWFDGQIITNPDLRLNNLYSAKVTGKVMDRSIMSLESADRWIAPPDFIHQLSLGLNIQYFTKLVEVKKCHEPVISTIPMPTMMTLSGWKDIPQFHYHQICTISMEMEDVDVYQTLYFPGKEDWYRASITGNKLMIESTGPKFDDDAIEEVALKAVDRYFGIKPRNWWFVRQTLQRYGKIVPIDDQVRKQFILAMTDLYNIYSLGRFATWRQLLLDDVVEDVQVVESFINQRTDYARKIYNQQ